MFTEKRNLKKTRWSCSPVGVVKVFHITPSSRAGGKTAGLKEKQFGIRQEPPNPSSQLRKRVLCHKGVARSPRPVPTPSGGIGRTKHAKTIPNPAQEKKTRNTCRNQGWDTLYPWTGLPTKPVLVGTHVFCLLRYIRKTALFLSCMAGLRAKLVPRWENVVFHLIYASQVLQARSQYLNPVQPHSKQYHHKVNKRERNSAHGSTIPVHERNGTNELWWYTIPYHLEPNNTRNIPIVCTLEKKTYYA